MGNPIAEIQLGLAVLGDIQEALPVLAQAAVDFKAAIADKSDPAKAASDIEEALAVVMPLINQALTLMPATPPSTTPKAA